MVMLTFPDIKKFSWNSKKKQSWNTTVKRSASGKVKTLTNQLLPLWNIDVSCPALTDEEVCTCFGFFANLKGSFEPFWWFDSEDNTCKGQRLPMVDVGQYQAVMPQGGYTEPVERIENVAVCVNGVKKASTDYVIDKGVIKFKIPPGENDVITADYQYYWRMMFKDDSLNVEKVFYNINRVSFSMVVAR